MKILMRIEKSLEAGIPEKMRVMEDGNKYLVQTYNETLEKWITQAYWFNPREALQDCANWYIIGEEAKKPKLHNETEVS